VRPFPLQKAEEFTSAEYDVFPILEYQEKEVDNLDIR